MGKKNSVSKIARGRLAKVLVFRGKFEKNGSGLTKSDLVKNKHGKVVSKKKSAFSKKSPWIAAVNKARTALKIKGFCAIKGNTVVPQGQGNLQRLNLVRLSTTAPR